MQLSQYNFTIQHMAGEINVWADLGTRWGVPTLPTTDAELKVKRLRVPFDDYQFRQSFVWPTLAEIIIEQKKFIESVNLPQEGDVFSPGDDDTELIPIRLIQLGKPEPMGSGFQSSPYLFAYVS
jgi:hypothetical protein